MESGRIYVISYGLVFLLKRNIFPKLEIYSHRVILIFPNIQLFKWQIIWTLYILLLILPTSISANQDSILTEGYFVTTSSSDSVQVERSTDRLTLTMINGSNIDLDLSEGKFQHQKIFGDRDR